MQVQIKRSEDSLGVMFAPTEDEAMCKIKEQYPDAVSVPWEYPILLSQFAINKERRIAMLTGTRCA
jgi:hypothetical protein